MSRYLPVECTFCGGVMDWGDFGPDPDDPQAGTTCACECICEHQRHQGPGGRPATVIICHEDCPFHGRKAEPDTWSDW